MSSGKRGHMVVKKKRTSFAKEKEISHLEIPKNVGGRFSVFSAVGMALVCLRDENLEAFVSCFYTFLYQQFCY